MSAVAIQTRRFEIDGSAYEVTFFGTDRDFRDHLERHILVPEEAWDQLLRDTPSGTSPQETSHVSVPVRVRLYKALVELLETGVGAALRTPLHLHVKRLAGASVGARLWALTSEGIIAIIALDEPPAACLKSVMRIAPLGSRSNRAFFVRAHRYVRWRFLDDPLSHKTKRMRGGALFVETLERVCSWKTWLG